jgi:Tol biopolymer transport system component
VQRAHNAADSGADRLGRLCLTGLLLVGLTACATGPDPQRYGLYASRLDGSEVRLLIADPQRQMTHIRVSPDREWFTFTRYHRKGLDGDAKEEGGYEQTEVLVARIDGTAIETIVAPKKGILNCNSSWTPDGKSLIWVSTENPARLPQIMTIELASRTVSRIPTPDGLAVSDPHRVGDQIVFPVIGAQGNVLWIMTAEGTKARQLTWPKFSARGKRTPFRQGDYDPKLSPDGRRVAFMRMMPDGAWHTFVVDVHSGREEDLAAHVRSGMDGVPEWSSDGRLLIFWHVDPKNLPETGVYTMLPDGTERQMLPLPRGYLHGGPGFLPGDGSGPQARIVWFAKRIPGLP